MPMTATTSVSLRQVLLPFSDATTSRRGWMLGLPANPSPKGLSRMLSQYAGLSILKLYEDGQTELQPHPILTPATGTTPPLPDWAWTPVEKDGFVHYARVVAPTRMRGSMPLAELPSRLHPATGELARFFLTARGTSAFGDTIYDVDVDIPVEGPEGYFTADLTLGGQQLATLHVTGGYVTLIEPSAFSFEHGLWTCHLARAALLASR